MWKSLLVNPLKRGMLALLLGGCLALALSNCGSTPAIIEAKESGKFAPPADKPATVCFIIRGKLICSYNGNDVFPISTERAEGYFCMPPEDAAKLLNSLGQHASNR